MPTKSAEPGVTGKHQDAKGRFTKGNRANPGGRPKEYRGFKQRCVEFMDAEGIARLIALGRESNEFALRLMAEYAYGKPQQHVDVTSAGGPLFKAYVGIDVDRV